MVDYVFVCCARYLDAEIGRCVTKDPNPGDPTNPQSLDRYTYCLNNPFRFIDPFGLDEEEEDRSSWTKEQLEEYFDQLFEEGRDDSERTPNGSDKFKSTGDVDSMMSNEKGHMTWVSIACVAMSVSGCISQNDGEFMSKETPLNLSTHVLIGTNEYLYAMAGKVVCIDWEGTIIWESEKLGGSALVFLGDAFLAKTYDKSRNMMGVAFLDLGGHILWQKETDVISSVGMGASHDLLAVGSLKNHDEGILWAFSRTGDILWTYDNPTRINEVCVAPDNSCVIITDNDNYIRCIRDRKAIWSHYLGKIEGMARRTIAFAPDSSYLVYGSGDPEPRIVASTPDGKELWSHPINEYIGSVAISDDGRSIIVSSFGYVYKFTPDGELVWETNIGANNDFIAITASADYIAVGSNTLVSSFIILNGDGEEVLKKSVLDTIWAVAFSPDGKYTAFSHRSNQVFIFT